MTVTTVAPAPQLPLDLPAAPGGGSPRVGTSRAAALRGEPPRPEVLARSPLTEESLLARGGVVPGTADAQTVTRMMESERGESIRYARRLLDLAPFRVDDGPESADEREEHCLAIAIALRTTTNVAIALINNAHIAVVEMPRTLERLLCGDMPREWHERLLRSVRPLTPAQRAEIDERVADWDLASIPAERFRDELRHLVAWFEMTRPRPRPEDSRDVVLESTGREDGTACLRITGPVPEIHALARRVDASARAVQSQQRHALREGAPIPFDLDGEVARTGSPMALAEIRYAIMLRTQLDTAGVEVPAPRHRVNVVIPVLTLMGLDDTPATYDGVVPLPAEMARALAAAEPVWHRVFTEPICGRFLRLPAQRYRPTPEMIEHLRLEHPRCAAPGCTSSTTDEAENDHIEEFDHRHPDRGGPTSLDNLHLLHWGHHDVKTARRIDPVREPDGSTTWTVGSPPLASTTVPPRTDLVTPRIAAALQSSWEHYQWLVEMDALENNGEIDRIFHDWGPVDPVVEGFEAADRREALERQAPPF